MSCITVASYVLAGAVGALFAGVLGVVVGTAWYFGLSVGELVGGVVLRIRLHASWRVWAESARMTRL